MFDVYVYRLGVTDMSRSTLRSSPDVAAAQKQEEHEQ